MIENRQEPRYALPGRAQLSFGEPPRGATVRLIDISKSGISFRCEVALPAGALVRLALSVLVDGHTQAATPTVRVRYCILEKDDHRVGGEFVDPDPATSAALASIVDARKKVVRGR